jgi:hypothetical protein
VAPAAPRLSEPLPSSPAVAGGGPTNRNVAMHGSPTVALGDDVKVVSAPAAPVSSDVASLWKRFIAEMWKKPSVASHLERAHLKSATEKEWVIGFVDTFAMESVLRHQVFLDDTATIVVGHPLKVRLVQQSLDRREGEEATVVVLPLAEEKARAAVQDVRVQKVIDVFKGKVRE